MELAPMDVQFAGQAVKMRRITFGDYSAARQRMLYDRAEGLPPMLPESVRARALAVPVSDDDLWAWLSSQSGAAFMVHRCLSCFDERITVEAVWDALMDSWELASRLYRESKLLRPTTAGPQSSTLSSADTGPVK